LVLVARWKAKQSEIPTAPSACCVPSVHNIPGHSTATIPLRHAFRDQLLFHGVLSHVGFNSSGETTRPVVGQQSPLLQALKQPTMDPALEQAMLATVAARIGRRDGHVELVEQSLKFYTASIHNLRRALLNSQELLSVQTLAACAMLHMYEFRECPNQDAYGLMSHYHGAMRLLELRGPDTHADGLAHAIFQFLRLSSVGSPRLCTCSLSMFLDKNFLTNIRFTMASSRGPKRF
jgi:hypothetical protein